MLECCAVQACAVVGADGKNWSPTKLCPSLAKRAAAIRVIRIGRNKHPPPPLCTHCQPAIVVQTLGLWKNALDLFQRSTRVLYTDKVMIGLASVAIRTLVMLEITTDRLRTPTACVAASAQIWRRFLMNKRTRLCRISALNQYLARETAGESYYCHGPILKFGFKWK